MKAVLHIDLDEDSLDITIREYLLNKLKKQDKNQSTLPKDEKKSKRYCNNPDCKKEVNNAIIRYCLADKDRFGGKVYCIDCQKNY